MLIYFMHALLLFVNLEMFLFHVFSLPRVDSEGVISSMSQLNSVVIVADGVGL